MSDPGMIRAGKKAIEKRDTGRNSADSKESSDPKPTPLPKKTGEAFSEAAVPGVQKGKEPARPASGSDMMEQADPKPAPLPAEAAAAMTQANTPGVQDVWTPGDAGRDESHENAMRAHSHAMAAHAAHKLRGTATGTQEMGHEPRGF